MSAIVLRSDEDIDIEIPEGASRSLRSFRRWALSPAFPQSCRIDFVAGQLEVDMSAGELFTHGTPKVEILRALANYLLDADIGMVLGDRMRVSSVSAGLSAEPDAVFVSYNSLDAGRVTITPAKQRRRNSGIELVGAVDLVAEILSRGSIKKDTQRLPKAYFAAGVGEFWLIDALNEPFRFQVYHRGRTGFVARRPDDDGWQKSSALGCQVRMTHTQSSRGYDQYRLEFQPESEIRFSKRKTP